MSEYNVRTFKTMTSDNNDNERFDCDHKTYISIIHVYLYNNVNVILSFKNEI